MLKTKIPEDYVSGWTPNHPGAEPVNLEVGTHVWDQYPTYEEWISQFDLESHRPNMFAMEGAHFGKLPVWSHGNAYLAGEKPYAKEEDKLVLEDAEVKIELVEKDGVLHL